MKKVRSVLIFGIAGLALVTIGVGVFFTLRSPLFTVQVVEIVDPPESAPVDAQTLSELANIPIGRVNLFDLDLRAAEERILKETWIREVVLQKRFPQTLSISVVYRTPCALLQKENGQMAYVDRDGVVFGALTLALQSDLPVLSGFLGYETGTRQRIKEAIQLIDLWKLSPLQAQAEISSVSWDRELGFRVLFTYQLGDSRGRTTVDLGTDHDFLGKSSQLHLARLSEVIRYLAENAIAARHIMADMGKKIVVKTARGS